MKILKLKALNINSLKGEVTIDFSSFLKDNALFAITGPTGAGKSTILDIITCALYGRTPRLKNPNELMARHTGECLCEVEFEIKGDIYRSSWTQKRARKNAGGKFQTAKMELSDVSSAKVIKSTLRDVPKYVEELSGLDFDRFIQSMMLAQGSFDAFLKAKESDRSTLLEKITGTQIYAKVSKEIYERYIGSKNDIDTHMKLLDSIELLDNKEVEDKTKILKQNKEQKQELDKKNKELLQLKIWLDSLSKLESDSIKYKELLNTAIQNKEDKKDEFLKLALANKALNVQTVYTRKNTLELDIQINQKSYDVLTQEIEELKKRLVSQSTIYEQSQKDTLRAKQSFDTETLKIKEIRVLQTQIDEKQKALNELRLKISSKQEEQSTLEKSLKSINIEYTKTQEELNTTKIYIQNNSIDERLIESLPLLDKHIQEYDKEINSLKELHISKEQIDTKHIEQNTNVQNLQNELKELNSIYGIKQIQYKDIELKSVSDTIEEQNLRTNTKKIESSLLMYKEYIELNKKKIDEEILNKDNIKEQQHLNTSIQIKQSLVDEVKVHITTLREKKDAQLLIKKYEDDRKILQEDDECFLCGSTTHPYIQNNTIVNSDETTTLIEQKQILLSKEEQEFHTLKTKLTKIESKLESSTLALKKLNEELESISEQFKKESYELNEDTKLHLEEEQSSTEEELNTIIQRRENKENLLKQKEIANTNYTVKQTEFLEKEKELTQTTVYKEQLLKDEEKSNKNLKELKEQLEVGYKEYKLIFDNSTYKEQYKLLDTRKQNYIRYQTKHKELESKQNQQSLEKSTIETNLKSIDTELNTYTIDKTQYEQFIKEQKDKSIKILNVADVNVYETEITNTFRQIQDKQNQLSKELTQSKTKQEELQKQEILSNQMLQKDNKEQESLKQKLNEELKNNDFEDIKAFEIAILEKEQRELLMVQCKDIEDKYAEYNTLYASTAKKLEQHKKEDIKIKPIDEVIQELKELNIKIDELQLNIGAISEVLKRNDQDRQKYQEKISEVEKKKESFQVWVKLNEMIGSADGNKFAKFAQGITLDQLINLANNHLSVLSSRYILQRSTEQKQLLEIEVIDSFQGDVLRPVSTLSGGESFIVSLSLALGLSELASQKIAIDSLFLDEGFGTLDEDSLETALNALNLLQSRGKMVGVISHVEALKERIPLQIRVLPKGDGTSFIEMG